MTEIDLTTRVREVPDFPELGVGFKDISPLLLDPEALQQAVGRLADWTRERGADLVLGAEARGFWLGAAIAVEVGCGFVAARRPGSPGFTRIRARRTSVLAKYGVPMSIDVLALCMRTSVSCKIWELSPGTVLVM